MHSCLVSWSLRSMLILSQRHVVEHPIEFMQVTMHIHKKYEIDQIIIINLKLINYAPYKRKSAVQSNPRQIGANHSQWNKVVPCGMHAHRTRQTDNMKPQVHFPVGLN